LVILYQKDYNTKFQNFINENQFQKEATDATKKFQTSVRKNISLHTLSPASKDGNTLTEIQVRPPLKASPRFTQPTPLSVPFETGKTHQHTDCPNWFQTL
jgi:hypothetical protein